MRPWRRVLAGRRARIALSSVVVCAFWLCGLCFGVSARQGVAAEDMESAPLQDADWEARHAALERLAARASVAGEAMLVTGAGAVLLLVIRRKLYRPERSSSRRTVVLVLVVIGGVVGMLFVGMWIPLGGAP